LLLLNIDLIFLLSDRPKFVWVILGADVTVAYFTVYYIIFRIAELHPSLAEAANHIAAAVHEEAAAGSATSQGSSSGYSYSLDALSDEEEMDSSQVRGKVMVMLFAGTYPEFVPSGSP
jgi:hypothetical protein